MRLRESAAGRSRRSARGAGSGPDAPGCRRRWPRPGRAFSGVEHREAGRGRAKVRAGERESTRAASPSARANITRRRSRRSATTPPQSEKTMIGTTRVRPTKPRASGGAGEQVDVPVEGHRPASASPSARRAATARAGGSRGAGGRGRDAALTSGRRRSASRGWARSRAAEIPRASTVRVSAGAMTPSSQRRAVE